MPSPRNKPSAVRTSLRFEPPTLEEAIYAAQGLTDDIDGQAEIAARLMGLPEPDVRVAILKTSPRRPARPSTQVRIARWSQQQDIPVPPLPDLPMPVPEVEPDANEGPDPPPEPSGPPGDDVPKVGDGRSRQVWACRLIYTAQSCSGIDATTGIKHIPHGRAHSNPGIQIKLLICSKPKR